MEQGYREVSMDLASLRQFPLQRLLFSCLLLAFVACSCGEDLKAANEKLKKEVADLSADNDRLKAEAIKLRTDLSALHSQVAELNMQLSSLQDQNQLLQKELDLLKGQVKGRRK